MSLIFSEYQVSLPSAPFEGINRNPDGCQEFNGLLLQILDRQSNT